MGWATGLVKSQKYIEEKPKTKDHQPNKSQGHEVTPSEDAFGAVQPFTLKPDLF
jgi:hypothetical protein